MEGQRSVSPTHCNVGHTNMMMQGEGEQCFIRQNVFIHKTHVTVVNVIASCCSLSLVLSASYFQQKRKEDVGHKHQPPDPPPPASSGYKRAK